MKTKSVIRMVVLISAVLSVACLITYRYNSGSGHQRINSVSNLKQIGLSFRQGRNNWTERFPWSVPANISDTNTQPSVTNQMLQR